MPSHGSRQSRKLVGIAVLLTATALFATSCSTPSHQGGVSTTTSSSTTPTTRPVTPTTPTTTRPLGWSAPADVGHGTELGAVVCPSTTSCIALGDQGQAYHGAGATWTGAVATGAATGAVGPPSISCAGPRFCMAVWRGAVDAVEWNGTSWAAPTPIGGAQVLTAIGCASSSFCVTVDGVGTAYYYDGSGWTASPNDWGSVSSISCPNANFCVSVEGGVSVWNGSDWTQPQVYGTTSVLNAVSCPTPTFCAAVDNTGVAIVWNGQRWSGPENLEAGSSLFNTPALTGVSCVSSTFCVAVDNSGNAFIWTGLSWSPATSIDPGHALTSVSCASLYYCVATDKQGFVLTRT